MSNANTNNETTKVRHRLHGLAAPPPVPHTIHMKRVLIIGHPGAGKSTFARQLGDVTGLPVIHLDKEYWRSGWVETPKAEWRERVAALAAAEQWIIDGSFDGTLDIRLPRAELVVWLDYPRLLCLYRAARRILGNYGSVRPDMAAGCPERIDWSFIRWLWGYRRNRYPIIQAAIRDYYHWLGLRIVTTPGEATRLLGSIRQCLVGQE